MSVHVPKLLFLLDAPTYKIMYGNGGSAVVCIEAYVSPPLLWNCLFFPIDSFSSIGSNASILEICSYKFYMWSPVLYNLFESSYYT